MDVGLLIDVLTRVWRSKTSPRSLAPRVSKARYFPRSTFFDAYIGYRSSYMQRSFLAVKELVHDNVNVWEDFSLEDHRRLGPKPDNCGVTYVRDLLSEEGDD